MAVSKIIGFDFQPGLVRAVALVGKSTDFRIMRLGEISVPIHDEAPEQFFPDEVSLAIKDWVREQALKGFRSAFAFQERKSILRVLSVPRLEEAELASTIQMEFAQVMEDSIDNYSLDFSIIGEDEVGGRLRVLVAIVPKASVYPYVDALESIRLTPVRAALPVLSSLSAVYSTKPEYLEGNTVCVHLETIGGDIIIFRDGDLAFVRRISLGLGELKYAFRGIVEAKPPAEVENIGGFKHDDYIIPESYMPLAKPLVDMLYSEVERSLSFFKSQTQVFDYTFERLVLCGNGIWPRNLDFILARNLPIPVVLANPIDWVRGSVAFEIDAEQELKLPRFCVALGVAVDSLG